MITKGKQIGYKGDAFGDFGTSMTGEPLFINDLNDADYYTPKQIKFELFISHKNILALPFHLVFVRFGRLRQCSWTKIIHLSSMKKYMVSKKGSVARYMEWTKTHRKVVNARNKAFDEKRQEEARVYAEEKKIKQRRQIENEYTNFLSCKYHFLKRSDLYKRLEVISVMYNLNYNVCASWFLYAADLDEFPVTNCPYSQNPLIDYKMFEAVEYYKLCCAKIIKNKVDRIEANYYFYEDSRKRTIPKDIFIRGLIFFTLFEKNFRVMPHVYEKELASWPVDRPLSFLRPYTGKQHIKGIDFSIIPGNFKMLAREFVLLRFTKIHKSQRDLIMQFLSPVFCMLCFSWSECLQAHPSDPRRPSCGCTTNNKLYFFPVAKLSITN